VTKGLLDSFLNGLAFFPGRPKSFQRARQDCVAGAQKQVLDPKHDCKRHPYPANFEIWLANCRPLYRHHNPKSRQIIGINIGIGGRCHLLAPFMKLCSSLRRQPTSSLLEAVIVNHQRELGEYDDLANLSQRSFILKRVRSKRCQCHHSIGDCRFV
jgi:hypothetical protein